jgi:hypothetical protein
MISHACFLRQAQASFPVASPKIHQDIGVDHNYDIFEILPDGSPMWKATAAGKDEALQQLELLSERCRNELRVIQLATRVVVATKPARAGA